MIYCTECGHEDHGRRRCVVYVSDQVDLEIDDSLPRATFFSSHPCNCMGSSTKSTDDPCDERMVVACTLMLNEKRTPC